MQLAARRGIETVSGVEMFVAQGTAQWEIWTGQRAPEKEMRAAVLAALEREEKRQGGRRSSLTGNTLRATKIWHNPISKHSRS